MTMGENINKIYLNGEGDPVPWEKREYERLKSMNKSGKICAVSTCQKPATFNNRSFCSKECQDIYWVKADKAQVVPLYLYLTYSSYPVEF